MSRVTNRIFFNEILLNINKNFERVQSSLLSIASGKKINTPSDDPGGMSRALQFRKRLASIDQFQSNAEHGLSWLNLAESSLSEISNKINEANNVAIQFSGGVLNTQSAISVIDSVIEDVVRLGNTTLEGRYIFAGTTTESAPFSSSLVYNGDNEEIKTEFDFNTQMAINIRGSEFLASDLDPDITSQTLLSDLHKGNGVSLGSISITDRAGNFTTVDLFGLTTVAEVLSTISNAAGINVTAAVNSSGNGITITDNNSSITGPLTIAEVGTGTTADNLGILGTRHGSLSGTDLDPQITQTTTISQLNSGSGLTLDDIKIINGTASGTVTFSTLNSSNTVGDMISLIDSAGLNVTGGINSNGTGFTVTSSNTSTVAVVSEAGTGKMASTLGLGGAKNVLFTLTTLKSALTANDQTGISAAIDNLSAQRDGISNMRGIIGSRVNRLETTRTFLEKTNVDFKSFLSDVEDTDIEKAALELATFQNAYEVSLAASAKIVNTSLLDFLR